MYKRSYNNLRIFHSHLETEQNYALKKDWQQYGTCAEENSTTMPKLGYRAKELRTGRTNNSTKRKASIDAASEFFRSSLPPIRADLAKAAQNTRHFMTEISFLKDHSSLANNLSNTNSNFKSPASSIVNPSKNNIQLGNGINSKGINNTMPLSNIQPNGGNFSMPLNSDLKCDEFTETTDVGTTINSRMKTSHGESVTVYNGTNGGEVNNTNSDRSQLTNSDTQYPSLGPGKRSHSQQIIATPHQPCCECLGCRGDYRDSMGDVTTENANKGAPICVLFAIFLLVSIVVISCVMVYLKAGRMHNII